MPDDDTMDKASSLDTHEEFELSLQSPPAHKWKEGEEMVALAEAAREAARVLYELMPEQARIDHIDVLETLRGGDAERSPRMPDGPAGLHQGGCTGLEGDHARKGGVRRFDTPEVALTPPS